MSQIHIHQPIWQKCIPIFSIFGLIDRPSLGCCAKIFSKWATLFNLKFGLPAQVQ
ncbi:hypothetical protein EJK55_0614 [Moraxella catarrhalis]|uniref:Uncharacterized protein n=1 Tax=Moraxella catarrhalis TaxID=480 RepID=A0ABY0BHV1_MORCA|nr:hypothetical protein MCR_1482 [Moraxella catarrhalis BBH18]AZQ89103.1 hypothetical protein EJK50_1622 [Moraxella catarrhalis]EKF82971.1 hypothetical protein MCRH_1567 [Moraxella catarrhalis RH4]RUO11794.1 hypothetical protein EJK55_0614 [Moraxella catarrhalis]RUO12763.1 hypothetical protein EJK54_0580 [Moraxella catarrhalis]